MKKQLLFISMVLIMVVNGFSQNLIPNADFENWTTSSPLDPVDWGTANYGGQSFNGIVTQETTDVYKGSSAILLTTIEIACPNCQPPYPTIWKIPGTAVSNGTINQQAPLVTGGFPYTSRPTDLNGFCKYLPQSTNGVVDISHIEVYLFKAKKVGGVWVKRDTVGYGHVSPTNTTYAPFSANIVYASNATPDTAQIILWSSKGLEATKDSKLYVDSLFFDFTTGVEELGANNFILEQNSPNPFSASTTIKFTCSTSEKVNFQIMDVLGRIVYADKINAESGINTINYISKLNAGTYFYCISDGKNVATKKMVITE